MRSKKWLVFAASLALCACSSDDNENNTNNTNNANNMNNENNENNVVIDCSIEEEFGGTIEEDTTLVASEGVCYVSDGIRVRALLTIEPGVVIKFNENAELFVQDDGRLLAQGTADAPIVFTGNREVRGYWHGIIFDRSDSIDNIIDHAFVQYAGGGDTPGGVEGRICCGSTGNVSISNTVIEESATAGLAIAEGFGATLDGNTFRNNTTAAASVHISHGGLLTGNEFGGNDTDVILIEGSLEEGEVALSNLGIPYRATGDLNVREQSKLTLEAGVTIEFADQTQLFSREGASLEIAGTTDAPVTLTGITKERGSWNGVQYDRSSGTDNTVTGLAVEYAGNDLGAGLLITTCCGQTNSVTIADSTFRNNLGYGVKIEGDYDSTVTNCTLSENELGAASVNVPNLKSLVGGTYTGNDIDIIEVLAGDENGEGTWINAGIPYRVRGNIGIAEDTANVTIEAGAVFEFESDWEFRADRGAILVAQGDTANRIIFKGAEAGAGFWKGVILDRSNRPENVLAFVDIDGAGGNGAAAALEISTCCAEDSQVTLNDISITNSATAGISLDSNVVVTGCANLSTDATPEVSIDDTDGALADFEALCQ